MPEDTRNVDLPDSLAARIEERLPASDFDSVDEYVTFVVDEVLNTVETEREQSEADEEEVQDRLRSLGYVDE